MHIRFLNIVLSGFLLCGFAMAEDGVINTNKANTAEAVEAMTVVEEEDISETEIISGKS